MKYFSVSFRTEKSDLACYYKDFGKAQLVNLFKKSAVMGIFALIIMFVLLNSDTVSLIIPLATIFVISAVMPYVFSKEISYSLYSSKQASRINRYDFYADHIEIYSDADQFSASSCEKHLKMNGFTSVAEGSTNFYFSYMNEKMLIIPKRVLNEEQYGMIKNLIENYFSSVYTRI